jgi:RimJ/RimL family protein N-acetyltransferase
MPLLNGRMTDLPDLRLPPSEGIDIRGYGLRLRPWRADDADDVAAMLRGLTDPDFLRWNTPLVEIRTEADAAQAIRSRAEGWDRGDTAHFCVTEGNDDIIGHIGLGMVNLRMRSALVGYWVLPEARGRGVARHSLELCTRWAFAQAGLHRIELGHALGHDASCRIAKRCGYRYEGVLRDGMFDKGRVDAFRDAHLHARLSTDPVPPEAD